MNHNIREADVRRKPLIKAISDFLRRVMSDMALLSPEPDLRTQHFIVPKVEAKTLRPPSHLPSTSKEMEIPKQGYKDDDVTEVAQKEEE